MFKNHSKKSHIFAKLRATHIFQTFVTKIFEKSRNLYFVLPCCLLSNFDLKTLDFWLTSFDVWSCVPHFKLKRNVAKVWPRVSVKFCNFDLSLRIFKHFAIMVNFKKLFSFFLPRIRLFTLIRPLHAIDMDTVWTFLPVVGSGKSSSWGVYNSSRLAVVGLALNSWGVLNLALCSSWSLKRSL